MEDTTEDPYAGLTDEERQALEAEDAENAGAEFLHLEHFGSADMGAEPLVLTPGKDYFFAVKVVAPHSMEEGALGFEVHLSDTSDNARLFWHHTLKALAEDMLR